MHTAILGCTGLYRVVPGCTGLYLSCTFCIFAPEIHSSALAGCFEYNIKTFRRLYRLYLTFFSIVKYFLQRVSTDMATPNRRYNPPTFCQIELQASNQRREMHLRGKIRSGTTNGTTFRWPRWTPQASLDTGQMGAYADEHMQAASIIQKYAR